MPFPSLGEFLEAYRVPRGPTPQEWAGPVTSYFQTRAQLEEQRRQQEYLDMQREQYARAEARARREEQKTALGEFYSAIKQGQPQKATAIAQLYGGRHTITPTEPRPEQPKPPEEVPPLRPPPAAPPVVEAMLENPYMRATLEAGHRPIMARTTPEEAGTAAAEEVKEKYARQAQLSREARSSLTPMGAAAEEEITPDEQATRDEEAFAAYRNAAAKQQALISYSDELQRYGYDKRSHDAALRIREGALDQYAKDMGAYPDVIREWEGKAMHTFELGNIKTTTTVKEQRYLDRIMANADMQNLRNVIMAMDDDNAMKKQFLDAYGLTRGNVLSGLIPPDQAGMFFGKIALGLTDDARALLIANNQQAYQQGMMDIAEMRAQAALIAALSVSGGNWGNVAYRAFMSNQQRRRDATTGQIKSDMATWQIKDVADGYFGLQDAEMKIDAALANPNNRSQQAGMAAAYDIAIAIQRDRRFSDADRKFLIDTVGGYEAGAINWVKRIFEKGDLSQLTLEILQETAALMKRAKEERLQEFYKLTIGKYKDPRFWAPTVAYDVLKGYPLATETLEAEGYTSEMMEELELQAPGAGDFLGGGQGGGGSFRQPPSPDVLRQFGFNFPSRPQQPAAAPPREKSNRKATKAEKAKMGFEEDESVTVYGAGNAAPEGDDVAQEIEEAFQNMDLE